MRWRLMLSVLLGVALGSAGQNVSGQGAGAQPRSNTTDQPASSQSLARSALDEQTLQPISSALLLETQVAKFRMILGRLSLDPPSHIKCERSLKLDCGGDERVEVTAARGIPSLHYRLETAGRELTVDVSDADHVRIESEIHDNTRREKVRIDQPAQGAIRLTIVAYDKFNNAAITQEVHASSFVHLKATYPGIYQRHIAPMLVRLLERPQIDCRATDLLTALEAASAEEDSLYQKVNLLVDQLRAPSRKTRNLAERDLRALGLPALCFIDAKIRRSDDLETEQLSRLRRVRSAILPRIGDSSRQLARWLASDVNYWNAIAAELSIAQLQTVQNELAGVTGQSLRPELRVADAGSGR